jgi:hypothetical protein
LHHGEDVKTINYNLTSIFEELKDYENALKIHFEVRKNAQKDKDTYTELFSLFDINVNSRRYERL